MSRAAKQATAARFSCANWLSISLQNFENFLLTFC